MGSVRRAFSVLSRLVYTACMLGLAAAIALTAMGKWSPADVVHAVVIRDQVKTPAYRTANLGSWRGQMPRTRPVRVVKDISPPMSPVQGTVAGQFDPLSDEIKVIPGSGDVTLAHEYGHAMLEDLIERHEGSYTASLKMFSVLEDSRQVDARNVPEWLRPTFMEYQRLPVTYYGSPYFGRSFNEYFAESFARMSLCRGKGVPPQTRLFLERVEKRGR